MRDLDGGCLVKMRSPEMCRIPRASGRGIRMTGAHRGGRHLVRAGKTTGDLFTSILRLFGCPATSFGFAGDSDLNTGGIPGLG